MTSVHGKFLTTQNTYPGHSAVDCVLTDLRTIGHSIIGTTDTSQTQFCLRLYEPAALQILSVAVFSADTVSPGIVITFSSIAAFVYQFKVVGKLAAAGDHVQIMAFAAQPAGIQAYARAAQIAAAAVVAGVAVDAVDGDASIELAALIILHLVDPALKGRIILIEAAVISAVGAHFAPVVTGPNAALSSFRVTAQVAHAFHQVVAFDAPQVLYRHLRVSGRHHSF